MIVMLTEQEKTWEEIEKILTENGIRTINTEKKIENLQEARAVEREFSNAVKKNYNADWLEKKFVTTGAILVSKGWIDEYFSVKFEKDRPEDYQSTYSIQITLDPRAEEIWTEEEDEIIYFIEELLEEEKYEYDMESKAMGAEEDWKIKLPKKAGTYKI